MKTTTSHVYFQSHTIKKDKMKNLFLDGYENSISQHSKSYYVLLIPHTVIGQKFIKKPVKTILNVNKLL